MNKLTQAYQALSKKDQKQLRIDVMIQCGVTERTFFNWLNGTIKPKEPAQKVLAKLFNSKPELIF